MALLKWKLDLYHKNLSELNTWYWFWPWNHPFMVSMVQIRSIFGLKICIFLRYTHKPQFFGLRRTRLNEIITFPCPEVTLDTFGFLVGARLGARRAVFWPRLPKMALLGAENGIFWPQLPPRRPPCDEFKTKNLPIWCPVMVVTKNFGICPKNKRFGSKNTVYLAQKSVFSTLRPHNPLVWPQTDPTQWDHIFLISSGNSECLWFFGRCPFGRSAGRFLAPIAQNGPFCGQ